MLALLIYKIHLRHQQHQEAYSLWAQSGSFISSLRTETLASQDDDSSGGGTRLLTDEIAAA